MQVITCPSCRTQLFLSFERAPKCGKCGAAINLAPLAPTFLSRLLRGLFGKRPADERKAKSPTSISLEAHKNLQAKATLLAKRAWGSREDIASVRLILELGVIERAGTHSEIVAGLLKHVRRVAPNLSVPMMTPRLTVEPLAFAAGQFFEFDGWVKIIVSQNFFNNRAAAQAILCHELCHYVLSANGIRVSPYLENERLTDTAIFVFGLGELFLGGYKQAPTENRAGHRVGYLSDDEFSFLERYVPYLRSSPYFLRTAARDDDWRWDRSLR